jgi:UDPglucose 6-dehydrogenase
VVERLQGELKILKGRTIALLGLAFKPDTDDLRDAPALDIARLLIQRKAKVQAHDPVALVRAQVEHGGLGICYRDTALEAVTAADAIVLVTEWPCYRDMPWEEIALNDARTLILDGRNFLNRDRLTGLGFRYIGMGR